MSILLWLQIYCHWFLETVDQKVKQEFQIINSFSYGDTDLLKRNKGTAQSRHTMYLEIVMIVNASARYS